MDAIANFVGDIVSSFDKSMMTLSVFIDLRKAFDSVSHKIILMKLEKLGIKGTALQWYTSYLSDCRQFVELGGHRSGSIDIEVGVPQGSLLGVLLFQILINDLPRVLKFSSSILYADDTTIYVIGKSLKFMKLKIQRDLQNLSEWLCANQLKLNVKKTKAVLFNKEGLSPNIDLEIDGEYVECVKSFKFLGITLDNSISFEMHYRSLHDRLLRS